MTENERPRANRVTPDPRPECCFKHCREPVDAGAKELCRYHRHGETPAPEGPALRALRRLLKWERICASRDVTTSAIRERDAARAAAEAVLSGRAAHQGPWRIQHATHPKLLWLYIAKPCGELYWAAARVAGHVRAPLFTSLDSARHAQRLHGGVVVRCKPTTEGIRLNPRS